MLLKIANMCHSVPKRCKLDPDMNIPNRHDAGLPGSRLPYFC